MTRRTLHPLLLQCATLVLLGFGAELLYSGFHRAFNLGHLTLALILVFLLPFAACLASHWFIECRSIWTRLLFVACGATGNVGGTWLVMTFF